jgi:TRAP-type C4-dicarboxylate transport system substrate-binding protein
VIPYQVVPSIKVNELVKFAAETDPKYPALYTTVFTIAMNKAKYDSLPADLKKVIDNNSGIEFSAMAGRVQEADDAPGRQKFKDAGVTINVPSRRRSSRSGKRLPALSTTSGSPTCHQARP